jgi:hypothetical protein
MLYQHGRVVDTDPIKHSRLIVLWLEFPEMSDAKDRSPAAHAEETAEHSSRRSFLQFSASAVGSFAVVDAFESLLSRSACGAARNERPEYGMLVPAVDENTGLELLRLPEGFRYVSYGWTGDTMADGVATPDRHDGMGVIAANGDEVTLCRNHEVEKARKSFGPPAITYDDQCGGGCTNLTFNTKEGRWLSSWAALTGTSRNCAGGPTPWGSWLSCEEIVGNISGDDKFDYSTDHGWIFEVPADQPATAVPIRDMGCFIHEAVAVDPDTGYVYETEDNKTSAGFYRFLPNSNGILSNGGRLQMLSVAGRLDLRQGIHSGQTFDVSWVDIDDPRRGHSPGTMDCLGVFSQGKRRGGSAFARLEGCWFGNSVVYLVSTNGGDAENGQVWQYDPRTEQLGLVFESPSAKVLEMPDNIAVSPRGGIVLCEDGDLVPQRLQGLTPDGRLFPFAANNVMLNGEKNGFTGDYRHQEWCGACFSPDGNWLFVNMQTPGMTYAITGPWKDGGL